MKKINFSIIIANYNGEKYLPDCLSSIIKTDYNNYEVILIEDGSTDKSLEIVKSFKKRFDFTIIQNGKNLGLVKSRNKATKKAKGEIVVFLDNDTKVDKNWLKGLEEIFSVDSTVGAAQCKIFDFNKQDIIQQVGMKLIPYTGFGTTLGRGQKDKGQFSRPQEIISLGAALAVRKEVLVKIRGFDQNLFHYTDDLDFSWRVWLAGYRVVLAPSSKIYHHIKIHNPNYKLYYHLSKNSLRMIIKNYDIFNMLKYVFCSLLLNLTGGFYVLFSRGSFSGIYGVFLGIIWSIWNFPDTIKERTKVQNSRKAPDRYIFEKIMISSNLLEILKNYFRIAKKTDFLLRYKK